MSDEPGKLHAEQIDNYNVFRWKEGLYCFKNKSFRKVMDDLEKYYDLKINTSNDSPAMSSILTGKFRLNEGIDYILRVLHRDVPFTYKRDIENNTITIR